MGGRSPDRKETPFHLFVAGRACIQKAQYVFLCHNHRPVSETTEPSARNLRHKRRKIALFIAYYGVEYQGMQRDPVVKTIEDILDFALFRSGAVPEADYGDPRKVDWMTSARADKGIDDIGQIVSNRFYIDPPGFLERLNPNLPTQIIALGYKCVMASFNAKKFCDRRRYVYLLPIFALDPPHTLIVRAWLCQRGLRMPS